MKQELKDIALQAIVSSPSSLYAVFTSLTVAERVALALGALQAIYLLRKWWREETEWGLKLKKLLGVQPTQPADL